MADDPPTDPLWMRAAQEVWGAHWQSEMATYFGKSRQWGNHLTKLRQAPPFDILIYMRELLIRKRMICLDLVAEIDATKKPGD